MTALIVLKWIATIVVTIGIACVLVEIVDEWVDHHE